jgi:hypothetical protein
MNTPQKWGPAVLAAVVAAIVIVPMISDPRFGTLHPADFLKMLGAGACLGIALTTFVVRLRG